MTEWVITSSVLIVIITVLRFALRGKISLKLQYALWGLVLIRLLIPFSIFESPASVLNILNEKEELSEPSAYNESYVPENITPAIPDEDIFILDDNIEHIKPDTNIVVDNNGYVTEPEITVIDWGDVLIGVWLVGTAVFGTVFAVSNFRFSKKLKNTSAYLPVRNTWLPVYVTSEVKTPCLFGVSKPAIYITKKVSGNEKVLHHVVEHETTHYRHGDNVWSVLRCLCLAVHWYNPLVWLAAFLSMRDSELACDEDTIKRIGENERVEYGRTLINLTCEKPAVGILSAATTMTGSKSSIKERIVLIAKKPKMLKITAAIVAIIAVFAVGCTFTGAIKYNPKTTENTVLETYTDHIFIDIEYSDVDKIVSMKITSASSEEITTEVYNDTYKDVRYSNGYRLQFEQDGKWYELPILDGRTTDMMFAGTSLKAFSSGKTSTWTNNIRESYGKLPDGKYRILRTFEYMGIAENSEAQSFVLATEFTLEDGKLICEASSALEKGEYIPAEQIFMNFASSFFGIPNERYRITDDAFVVYDSESGKEIENIAVQEWEWQEFPYSEEEWKNLFIATDEVPFPDISGYRNRYYQPLDDRNFIAFLDGELWFVDIDPKKPSVPDDLWVWDIYRIIPDGQEEKLFDAETERLMEILWNVDFPYKEIAENGYTFYGAEEQECLGYENLFSFAEKYPSNKGENFYIAALNTTWELFKISYSKDQKSWIYTEYWIDTFHDNERNEKSFEILEIKIYDNRISIYFKSGGKQVIYRDGSVQGLPINNCSHPEQAHYIDYEIIKYINSEEFRAEYEKNHSEPYLDFDEFTDTLYAEEEKCIVNIYHYIEHYGLSYDDFVAAYGTEERVAEIWGEADIKGYYEYRESGIPLTADEIRRVSEAFESYRIEGGKGYPNLLAIFLQSEYNKPEKMNAVPFLYYFPSGMLITDESEFEDLKKTWASYGYTVPEGTTIDDYPLPLHKIPKSNVDEALEKYLGIALNELRNSDFDSLAEGGIYYMEKYDCFYSTASDAHGGRFDCISGEKYSDGTVVLYGEGGSTLILKKHPDGSYKIYSYQS